MTRDTARILVACATASVVTIAAVWFLAAPARGDETWVDGVYRERPMPVAEPPRRRAPEVRSWRRAEPVVIVRREREPASRPPIELPPILAPSGPICERLIEVVGDQYLSEAGARDQADKAWRQTARYYFGERYADSTHANNVTTECPQSSIGSVAGQVFYRCRMTGYPCRARSEAREK